MVLLPSGCWVIAPRVLTKKDGTPVGRLSLLDALSPATWATGDSGLPEDAPLDTGSSLVARSLSPDKQMSRSRELIAHQSTSELSSSLMELLHTLVASSLLQR